VILEFQPAERARLIGDPPSAVHIVGCGGTDVAPGLLEKLGQLAGKPPASALDSF
jgi:hypothetical protein